MGTDIKKGFGSIVAKSEYTRRRKGRASAVRIEIGAPQELARDGERSAWWACPYRIVGLERAVAGRAGGLDSYQALQLAMQAAAEQLLASPELARGRSFSETRRWVPTTPAGCLSRLRGCGWRSGCCCGGCARRASA